MKWLSRKFVTAIIGTILVPFLQMKGVPAEAIEWLVGLLMTYIGGESVIDAVRAYKATETAK